jgi:hypothetical protein
MKALRIFCQLCNKGLLKDRVLQLAAAQQRDFMIEHFKETNGTHNAFGVELCERDLYGAYLKAQSPDKYPANL